MKELIVIIGLMICGFSASTGQDILKQLTTDDGLSEVKCFDVFQDSKGYIWIGTSAGANKYDGRDVVKFDRSNGLLSDHIYSFHEDSQNRIWVNNLNGEPLYIKDDVVHNRFTNPELNDFKSNKYFVSIAEDSLNRIWFGHSDRALDVLEKDTAFRILMPLNIDSLLYDFFGAFPYEDEIIIVSSFYLKSLDLRTLETNWIIELEDKPTLLRKVLHNDKLYLFHLHESHVFDLKTKEFKKIERLDGNVPIYDCRVVYDKILLSTSEGVSAIEDSVIVEYKLHSSIDSIAITALHEDIQGNLWISTLKNGVYIYYKGNVEKSNFGYYCDTEFISEYSDDSLFIIQDDWKVNLIKNNEKIWSKQLVKRDENKFNTIFHKGDELWIVDKYQIHMDVEGDYKVFSSYSRKINYNEKDNSYLWIGTRGINFLEDIDEIFDFSQMKDVMEVSSNKYKFFPIDNPHDFQIDSLGVIWIGGEQGLFRLENNELEWINIPELNGSITKLYMKGETLFGINYGKGVFKYNINTGQAQILSREDGLPTNYFTHSDINGEEIWVSHANGICLLRDSDEGLRHIKSFGSEQGIPKGRIMMIKISNDLCHFVVNGKVYTINPIYELDESLEIIMDDSEMTFFANETRSVDFDCINFTFGDKINYEYRLVPYDMEWTESNRESIDLENIPSGDYELEVRAKHPYILSSTINSKPIYVKDRWYKENYFRAIVFLLFCSMLYFLIRIKAISFNLANFKLWVGEKVKQYFDKEERKSFNIKDINGVVHLLKVDEIKFIKSSGNYLEYHTEEKKYVSRMTMSNAVEKFKIWTDIERVHRSYMVNFKLVEAIDHRVLRVGNSDIPFTDRYREVIEHKLQL